MELLVQRRCFHGLRSGRTAVDPTVLDHQVSRLGFESDLLGRTGSGEHCDRESIW